MKANKPLGAPAPTQDSSYYAALGRFIHWFTATEASVHSLFRHFTGLPEWEARAISGGMRISDLMSMTRRLMIAKKTDEAVKLEVERLFGQIGEVEKLRHALVHRGGNVFGAEVVASNLMTMAAVSGYDSLHTSVAEIGKAARDCQAIFLRIGHIISPERSDLELATELTRPWLYRHPAPRHKAQASRSTSTPQAREHRPSPSQE